MLEALWTTAKWARTYERPDLVERLKAAESRLLDPAIRVLVVGEYKKGKSSLIDALLNASVCPVDVEIATAIPTEVRYAEQPEAHALLRANGAEGPSREPVDLEGLAEVVTEAKQEDGLLQVVVGLPRDLLAGGLRLVDTPGVGGLASVHGAATMAALPSAEVVLFVSDASQELTAPELEFLRVAAEASPNVCCVLTKIDLYPEWRKIVDLDVGHLRESGIEVEVIPVSSVLRQLALDTGDRELNRESGYPRLIRYLEEALADAERIQLASTAHDQLSTIGHLELAMRSELAALAYPASASDVVTELEQVTARAARLRESASRWQVTLSDGISDLSSDVDHGLRLTFRTIMGEADASIDKADPAEIWDELRTWVQHRVAAGVAETYTALGNRAAGLAERVASHFEEDAPEFHLSARAPEELLQDQGPATLSVARAARAQQALTALQRSYSGPMMVSFIGGLAGLAAPILTPVGIAFGLLLGGKAVRDERKRQVAQRRQEAKAAIRRYLEEASLRVSKEMNDTVRRTHRGLRDTFLARAEELQRAAAEAVGAAQEAVRSDQAGRQQRLDLLGSELPKLEGLRAHIASLVPRPASGPEKVG